MHTDALPYQALPMHTDAPFDHALPSQTPGLRGDYEGAYGLTRPVLLGGRDPYALQLLPVFLAAATQLASTGGAGSGPRTDLYLLGHRLTEEHPDMARECTGVCISVRARGASVGRCNTDPFSYNAF